MSGHISVDPAQGALNASQTARRLAFRSFRSPLCMMCSFTQVGEGWSPARARLLVLLIALVTLNAAGVLPWTRWTAGVCAPLAPAWSTSTAQSAPPCELRPAPPPAAEGPLFTAVVLTVATGIARARIHSRVATPTDEPCPPSRTVRPLVPPPLPLAA